MSPDFDGDGTVGFADFVLFAGGFGTSEGDSGYRWQFDLDGDGAVGFSDFVIFAGAFGSRVPPSGGGTPPSGSPADLVVESVSVSDSTLTPRQILHLERNRTQPGNGRGGGHDVAVLSLVRRDDLHG